MTAVGPRRRQAGEFISFAEIDAWVTEFLADPSGWTVAGVQGAVDEFGALGAPLVLSAFARHPGFPAELLHPRVVQVWASSWRPNMVMGHEGWRALFDVADYTVDGVAAERLAEPLTLWRGTELAYRWNWTWTADRLTAVGYADRRKAGRLWKIVAPPSHVLGKLTRPWPEPPPSARRGHTGTHPRGRGLHRRGRGRAGRR